MEKRFEIIPNEDKSLWIYDKDEVIIILTDENESISKLETLLNRLHESTEKDTALIKDLRCSVNNLRKEKSILENEKGVLLDEVDYYENIFSENQKKVNTEICQYCKHYKYYSLNSKTVRQTCNMDMRLLDKNENDCRYFTPTIHTRLLKLLNKI